MPAARSTHPAQRRTDARTVKLTDRVHDELAAHGVPIVTAPPPADEQASPPGPGHLDDVALIPGQASGPAVVTGLIFWFLFTARADLALPPGR